MGINLLGQIDDTKNIPKAAVQYRLKISELSEEIKVILRSAQLVGHLMERHVLEVCRLSAIPYQKRVLEEIILKNSDPNKKVFGSKRFQDFSSYGERISYEDVKARREKDE